MKRQKPEPRQKTVCGLALSLALALCACSANTENTSGAETPVADGPQQKSDASDTEVRKTPITEEAEEPTVQPSAEEPAADEAAVIISEDPASPVTVTMQTETPYDTSLCLADGTEYYTADYSYPVVSIAGRSTTISSLI